MKSTAREHIGVNNSCMTHETWTRLITAAQLALQRDTIKPADLKAVLGQSAQTMNNWAERGVSKPGALIAQRRLGINPAWILSGDLPLLVSEPATAGYAVQEPPHRAIDLENNPDYPAIRRVRFKLSAGASGFGIEYRDEDGAPIVFQRDWFASRGYKPEKLFAVKVANGSMEPGLFDGDTVVVNTAQTTPRDGVVFAINYEGELVVKRLVRDGGQWWLCSDNPDQRRFPRKLADEHCHILGEIVHKQSERI